MQAATTVLQQTSGSQAAASGQGQSSATALQLVKVLQQQVANLDTRLMAQDKTRKELKKVRTQLHHGTEFCSLLLLTLVDVTYAAGSQLEHVSRV